MELVIRTASDLLIRCADRRIAAVLLRLSRENGFGAAVSELRLSQAELGEIANASRGLVNRNLVAFARRGWIELGYGCIVVHDPAALEALAAGEARRRAA